VGARHNVPLELSEMMNLLFQLYIIAVFGKGKFFLVLYLECLYAVGKKLRDDNDDVDDDIDAVMILMIVMVVMMNMMMIILM
jgi:hypothetical protein